MLNSSNFTSIDNTKELSEYLGEHVTTIIIQNVEKMGFDEMVEFKKSLEVISKAISGNFH